MYIIYVYAYTVYACYKTLYLISIFYLYSTYAIYIYSILELWKANLRQVNEKAAEALADPAKYPNLFPDLNYGLMVG